MSASEADENNLICPSCGQKESLKLAIFNSDIANIDDDIM